MRGFGVLLVSFSRGLEEDGELKAAPTTQKGDPGQLCADCRDWLAAL